MPAVQKFFIRFTCIFILGSICDQALSQTSSRRLLGTFIFDNRAYDYEFTMEAFDSYSLNISAVSEKPAEEKKPAANSKDSGQANIDSNQDVSEQRPDSTQEAIRDTSGTKEDDTTAQTTDGLAFNEFSKGSFQTVFYIIMLNKKYVKDSTVLSNISLEVFYKIKARLDFIDDEPVTGYFILRKNKVNSFLSRNASKYYDGKLSRLIAGHYIHRVEVETEDGALKNITAYLVAPDSIKKGTTSPRQFLLFKNQFPISMSGKFDYEKFSNIDLYCYNCNGVDGLARFIRLMDLAIFDIVYANDKEDYSPSNRTFTVTPSHPIEELKKEKRSKIFEVAAFTDFIGLDRNEPNGLLQIEARRRININTKYRLLVRSKSRKFADYDLGEVGFIRLEDTKKTSNYGVYRTDPAKAKKDCEKKNNTYKKGDTCFFDTLKIPFRKFRSPYFNFFGYIEPKLLFSKLEETNRFVDSAKAGEGVIDPITLYQYQIASFGVNVQILRLSFPQYKLQWNMLNAGVFWSRTRVALTSDSAGPTSRLNSNFWQFGSSLTFRPDSRWGTSIGFEYILPRIWDNNYKLSNTNGLFQAQFDGWLKTGTEGKLFYRFRWTYENKNRNNNFTQVQLGYSLNLFAGSNNKSNNN